MNPNAKRPIEPQVSHLLLVDDDRPILTALAKTLSSKTYVIHTAPTGVEGLKVLERQPVDLIISDMRMPEMNGVEFLEKVYERWPDIICILLTAYSDIEDTVNAINKGHIFSYFSKPWDRVKLLQSIQEGLTFREQRMATQQVVSAANEQNQRLKDSNSYLERAVNKRTEELNQTSKCLEMAYDQIKQTYMQTVNMFAQIVERMEVRRGGHGRRVAELASKLAKMLGMDEKAVTHTYTAGLLHDAGKIVLNDRIRNKPYTKLTLSERALMHAHPVEGEAMLMSLEPLHPVAELIRYHHENFDGSGYPDGIRGQSIPMGARIISVCDYYDSLVNGYHSGKSMMPAGALKEMRAKSGARFDPIILQMLRRILKTDVEDLEEAENERSLVSTALEPGMCISRTLYTTKNVPLIVAETKLTMKLINKLISYEEESNKEFTIFIYKDTEEDKEGKPPSAS